MTGSHTLVLRMITFLLTVAMLFTDSRESREVICDLDCSFLNFTVNTDSAICQVRTVVESNMNLTDQTIMVSC